MSCLKSKSLLVVASAALVAVPLGASADSYDKVQQEQMRSESRTSGQMKSGTATPMQRGTTSQLQSMTPSQLRGADVVSSSGEQIGTVKKVVQSRQDGNIHAVIASGGMLGVGDREITVPLDRLTYDGGKLRLSASADELKASPAYRNEQYVEVQPMDQPISEFSAFEAVPDRSTQGRTMRSDEQRRGDWGASTRSARSPDPNALSPKALSAP